MVILPILKLALFFKERTICRARSTFVERRQSGKDGRVGQKTEDRRQNTEYRIQNTEDRMRFGDEFPACRDMRCVSPVL